MHDKFVSPPADPRTLRRRIRWLLALFIAALLASGLTAVPLSAELDLLAKLLGIAPDAAPQSYTGLQHWIATVRQALHETYARWPFMAYGTDWLAFAHVMIAVAFLGPWRDPVRNAWVIDFGIIACLGVIPVALGLGALRGIPLYWRLIDCSFGVFGLVPLGLVRHWTKQLAQRDSSARPDDVVPPPRRESQQAARKQELYADLARQARALLAGQRDGIANMANLAALLYHVLPDVSWAGFYLRRGEQLLLGPFQGQPACTQIALGKGVCGTAAARRETIVVPDVHQFPGHIACDPQSQSEMVVPIIVAGDVFGVLDLDSQVLARFDEHDRQGLESLVALFIDASDFA